MDRTGLTQEQAAKRLGVSTALIRHVAAGRRNMSASLRDKIRQVFAFGVDKPSVGAGGYDRENDRDDVAEILGEQIRALVHASAGRADKGASVVADLSAALDTVLASHKLSEKVAEYFKSTAATDQQKMTRRQVDDSFRKAGAPFTPAWDKVRETIPPDAEVTLTTVKAQQWFAPRSIQSFGLVTKARLFSYTTTVHYRGKARSQWTGSEIKMSVVNRS